MTCIYLWLWFGTGIGMAADFWHEYKTRTNWFVVVLVAIFGPVFFPMMCGRLASKLLSDRK